MCGLQVFATIRKINVFQDARLEDVSAQGTTTVTHTSVIRITASQSAMSQHGLSASASQLLSL
jgi:hypothetical protein